MLIWSHTYNLAESKTKLYTVDYDLKYVQLYHVFGMAFFFDFLSHNLNFSGFVRSDAQAIISI